MNDIEKGAWAEALQFAFEVLDANPWKPANNLRNYAVENSGKFYPNKEILKHCLTFLEENYPEFNNIPSLNGGKPINDFLATKGANTITLNKADDKLLNFKYLLEYFVSHLDWIVNNNQSLIGYDKYISPLVQTKKFKITGQGYNGEKIQKQISEFDYYEGHQVCINITYNQKVGYQSKFCYLNWISTGINIIAEWKGKQIIGLYQELFIEKQKPEKSVWESLKMSKSLENLGLFDNSDTVNANLIAFYTNFKDAFLNNKIQRQNNKIMTKINDKVRLLEFKKQIILQGPPGTGKTKLAKEIARELVGAKRTVSPLEYVENYIKTFTSTEQSSKTDLTSYRLISEFKESFPLEKIRNLSIDEYALGNGSQDSFCYWIEQKLAHTCRFSPGGAGTTVYGISYNKQDGTLRVDNNQNPDEFMSEVSAMLIDLIENEDYTKARKMKFWYSFILKILHSYNPEKYFPVLSKDHLKFFAKIFEIDSKGADDIILNKKINEIFNSLKVKFKSPISSIVLMRHLYDKFKIKEGLLAENIEIKEGINLSGNYKIIQFHPSYTYEDFVRGISTEVNIDGQIEYKAVDKVLSEMAKEAFLNKSERYVLIIDEINRANLSSVLGELIYALEYRYFFNDSIEKQKEAEVESLYGIKNETGLEHSHILSLPENLYIIGTMNTADRSVGHIDYAIRRRFAFIDVLPQRLNNSDEIIFNHTLYESVSKLFVQDFSLETEYNSENISNNKDYLSAEFSAKDVWLGHSYFIQKIKKDESGNVVEKIPTEMSTRLNYEIKPILMEYVRDGVLKHSAIEVIKNLSI